MAGIKVAITGSDYEASQDRIRLISENTITLPVDEIKLVDFDKSIATKLIKNSRRLFATDNIDLKISIAKSYKDAYENVDFVVFQKPLTESVNSEVDLRIIVDRLLNTTKQMEEYCHEAWLIVVTNPLSTLLEIINRHSTISRVGVSEEPHKAFLTLKHFLGEDSTIQYVGLNEFGFVTSIIDGGGMEKLRAIIRPKKSSELFEDSIHCTDFDQLDKINAITSQHLLWLYNQSKEKVSIESSVLIDTINSIYLNIQSIQIVTTVNNGALKFLKDSDMVETFASVSGEGIVPLSIEVFENLYVIDYLKKVKENENKIIASLNRSNKLNSRHNSTY